MTKKDHSPKMAGQDSRRKKDRKSSKGVEALKYLMGQRSNKRVVIGRSSESRKDKEKEDKGKVAADFGRKLVKGKGHTQERVFKEDDNVLPP